MEKVREVTRDKESPGRKKGQGAWSRKGPMRMLEKAMEKLGRRKAHEGREARE